MPIAMVLLDWLVVGALLVGALLGSFTQRRWLGLLIVAGLLGVVLWNAILFEPAVRYGMGLGEKAGLTSKDYFEGLRTMDRTVAPLRTYMLVASLGLAIIAAGQIWRHRT
jgi:hypothetical protein